MHSLTDLFSLPLKDPILVFFILLTAAFVIPWLARRLRFPEVLGLILLGVLLGPHALGILERDRIMSLFASVGLLFLMFIAGLEIDAEDFRKHRTKSFWFGFLTFTIPMLLGTTAGLTLLGMNLKAALLLASMFASHTLLAYPAARALKIHTDPAVGAAVGGTIITDVAALLVLAVIAGLSRGSFGLGTILRLSLSLSLFAGFEIFLLPGLAARVYERLEKEGDLQFLFTLLVLFGSGVLAEIAGVEPIIGAFLAGIAVGRHIPPLSALANRVEFFGNTVFVPAFLISVGMTVDPRAFAAGGRTLLVSAVMLACVTLSKFLASQTAGMTFGWDKNRRGVVFGLSVVQAAATLAAVFVGYELKIFDEAVLNGTIVMIAGTVILGTLSVRRFGMRMAESLHKEVPDGKAERRILLAVSSPRLAERLTDLAITLRGENGRIRAVKVLHLNATSHAAVAEADALLSSIISHAAASEVRIESSHRADTGTAHGVAAAGKEFLASVIVTGLKTKRSFLDKSPRSFLSALLKTADQPVIAARLDAPLSTIASLRGVILTGASKTPDFRELLLFLLEIARHSRARLSLTAPQEDLNEARTLLKKTKASIDFLEETDAPLLPADAAKKNLTGGHSITAVLCLRPDRSAAAAGTRSLLSGLDSKYRAGELILCFPSRPRAASRTELRGLAGILNRLFRFRI